MKLAQRLTLALVLVLSGVLIVESSLSARRELRLYTEDTRHDEHVTAQALAVAITRLVSMGQMEAAMAVVDQANRASGRSFVRWLELGNGPTGAPRTPLSPDILQALERGSEDQLVIPEPRSPGRFVTYVPVRVGNRLLGALELSESLAQTREYVRSMYWYRALVVIALAALSGLIAMGFGVLFVGGPIRKLVEKTRRIASGDLSRPLGFRQHDEIGVLAGAIDLMCVQLAEARERLAAETASRLDAVERMRHSDRLATVGKLASGVAHELGTPLNVASIRASMIANGEVTGARAADSARVITEQTRRIMMVIRQLLDFARRQTPRTARHDLRILARQTADLVTPLAERRGVALRVHTDATPVFAEVDAGQIQQALTNLLVNALEAVRAGDEVSLRVGTRAGPGAESRGGGARSWAYLEVRDGGAGILPENLPQVFEPFFTTKEPGEGTGLGLAVANGIVRDHRGWISAASTPQEGSRFAIHLPWEGPDGSSGTLLPGLSDAAESLPARAAASAAAPGVA